MQNALEFFPQGLSAALISFFPSDFPTWQERLGVLAAMLPAPRSPKSPDSTMSAGSVTPSAWKRCSRVLHAQKIPDAAGKAQK